MNDKTYNGWTNYATCRVNLEMIDGIDPREMFGELTEIYDLENALREYCEDYIQSNSEWGIVRDYAFAFISDVDWHQIAKNLAQTYELTLAA